MRQYRLLLFVGWRDRECDDENKMDMTWYKRYKWLVQVVFSCLIMSIHVYSDLSNAG
jgi:hypothetical protein